MQKVSRDHNIPTPPTALSSGKGGVNVTLRGSGAECPRWRRRHQGLEDRIKFKLSTLLIPFEEIHFLHSVVSMYTHRPEIRTHDHCICRRDLRVTWLPQSALQAVWGLVLCSRAPAAQEVNWHLSSYLSQAKSLYRQSYCCPQLLDCLLK